jgi:hypothetical protein
MALIIISDPTGSHYLVIEAAEPGIDLIVSRTGLASDVLSTQRLGPHRGATLNYFTHHRTHDKSILGRNDARCILVGEVCFGNDDSVPGINCFAIACIRFDGLRLFFFAQGNRLSLLLGFLLRRCNLRFRSPGTRFAEYSEK